MIKPDFTVTQDEEFVNITIKIRYVKISNAEFDIDDNNFKFYLKPYLLDLYFPGKIVSDQRAKSSYDIDAGTLLCKIPKEKKGEFFPNLDMLTTLLKPKEEFKFPEAKRSGAPLIEVVSSQDSAAPAEKMEDVKDKTSAGQELPSILVPGPPKYGFNDMHTAVFKNLEEEMRDICDIDVEHATKGSIAIFNAIVVEERWKLKREKEQAEFDYDRYVYDTFMCEEVLHPSAQSR